MRESLVNEHSEVMQIRELYERNIASTGESYKAHYDSLLGSTSGVKVDMYGR